MSKWPIVPIIEQQGSWVLGTGSSPLIFLQKGLTGNCTIICIVTSIADEENFNYYDYIV
jgi:hypothetical protein